MRDADDFVYLFSFGNLMIEESRFINAREGAIHLEFGSEISTPEMTTIRNCLFQNNKIQTIGSAFLFRTSNQTKNVFALNVLFSNNTFLNNQAQCKI